MNAAIASQFGLRKNTDLLFSISDEILGYSTALQQMGPNARPVATDFAMNTKSIHMRRSHRNKQSLACRKNPQGQVSSLPRQSDATQRANVSHEHPGKRVRL